MVPPGAEAEQSFAAGAWGRRSLVCPSSGVGNCKALIYCVFRHHENNWRMCGKHTQPKWLLLCQNNLDEVSNLFFLLFGIIHNNAWFKMIVLFYKKD